VIDIVQSCIFIIRNSSFIAYLFLLKVSLTPKGQSMLLNSRKIIVKYYLEEYFGIDVGIKVRDLKF
jgi:hypothetical protein